MQPAPTNTSSHGQLSIREFILRHQVVNNARKQEAVAREQFQSAHQQLRIARSQLRALADFQRQPTRRGSTATTNARRSTTTSTAAEIKREEEEAEVKEDEDDNTLIIRDLLDEVKWLEAKHANELRGAKTGYKTFLFVFCLGALAAIVYMSATGRLLSALE